MVENYSENYSEFSIGGGRSFEFLYHPFGYLFRENNESLTLVENFPHEFYIDMDAGSFRETIYLDNNDISLSFADSFGFSPIFENFRNLDSDDWNCFEENLPYRAMNLLKGSLDYYDTLKGLNMRSYGLCIEGPPQEEEIKGLFDYLKDY